jgi:hypothetical protein
LRWNSSDAARDLARTKSVEKLTEEKVPWYRAEEDDVINARYAKKLLDASSSSEERKEPGGKKVGVDRTNLRA